MNSVTIKATVVCECCGREIHGRSDKRFCNDTCRNNFNRAKRLEERVDIPEEGQEIIRIIKTNYRLLKARSDGDYTRLTESLPALRSKGFNPNFFTSIGYEQGETYFFCFECGFSIYEDTITIIERDQQSRIANTDLFFNSAGS
jgi:hypothetical protein